MVITRIAKMKNLRIFREFTWPSGLADFGRYNLIYGWNGTGKTTLSNLFRAIETRSNIENADVTVKIDKQDKLGSQFAQISVPIRVFNRHFMAEYVFTTDHIVTPIYVLGKENVEKQRMLDAMKVSIEDGEKEVHKCRDTKSMTESALDNFCISRAKTIKDTLGREGNYYSTYDKRNFQDMASRLAELDSASEALLDKATRQKLFEQHAATPKQKVSRITYEIPDLEALSKKVSALLSATVVSAIIDSLSMDPKLAAWIFEGLKKHKDRNATSCLFCGQELPPGRMSELAAHFNDEYERLQESLHEEREEVSQLMSSAEVLSTPDEARLYDYLADEYKSRLAEFQNDVRSVKAELSRLGQALERKKAKPFEAQQLEVSVTKVPAESLNRANEVISKHNQACDEFSARVKEARQKLECYLAASEVDEYRRLRKAVEDAKITFQSKQNENDNLKREFTKLTMQMVEHRESAEELNRDLCSYLGHDELRLDVKDTGYQITRQGEVAKELSEGETTAIALLYFLKSLSAQGFDLQNGIVVLDDPVSSLDSNALFSAFGFIKERTQHAKQLIVLTHNFSFFRQVRNWYDYLNRRERKSDVTQHPARFYMLECTQEVDGRCARIRRLDPLLERFDSEYHYLFAYVYRAATAPPRSHLEQNYLLPNLARRLLETFLGYRLPNMSGGLTQKLEIVEFDETKKIRMLRFVHTHSHGKALGEPEHDLSLLSEAHSILKDILSLMQSQDPHHFSAMVSMAKASGIQGEAG